VIAPRARVLALVGFVGIALGVAAACGGPSSTSCTLTANGSPCKGDGDCCSGYCKNYPDVPGAYCQDKVNFPPKAIAGNFCTQDAHCESGLCNGNVCFGTPPQPGTCDEVGSQCLGDGACCTNICNPDANGRKTCAYPPSGFDAGACLATSSPCKLPSDCCSGFCVLGSCAAKSGGGSSCGKAGAGCRSGIDCCSGQCTKLGSGATQCR
jgi:hypothetical protein